MKCLAFFFAVGNLFLTAAPASEFQLRAGYGLTPGTTLGAGADGTSVDASASGASFAAFLTGPDTFLDLGVQYEQLVTPSTSDNLDITFRRLAFVLEKKITWDFLLVSPHVGFGFLNTAQYKSGTQEVWRASEPFTLSAGLGVGARFSWAGILLESGYRWARLTQAIKSTSGDDAGPPFSPNWSSFYFRTSLLVWL